MIRRSVGLEFTSDMVHEFRPYLGGFCPRREVEVWGRDACLGTAHLCPLSDADRHEALGRWSAGPSSTSLFAALSCPAPAQRTASAVHFGPSTKHSLTTPMSFMPLFARATTTTTDKTAARVVDAEALVFHVDILLCALLALPFLLNAPRLLARFSSGDQWRG
jgi:hypothetical protein